MEERFFSVGYQSTEKLETVTKMTNQKLVSATGSTKGSAPLSSALCLTRISSELGADISGR